MIRYSEFGSDRKEEVTNMTCLSENSVMPDKPDMPEGVAAWTKVNDDVFECSNCGRLTYQPYDDYEKGLFHFCPHCGKIMVTKFFRPHCGSKMFTKYEG